MRIPAGTASLVLAAALASGAGQPCTAKAADPAIKTLHAYSQDFVDQAKCKEIALNQIAQGSKVVFQVAGQCGLGALDAAKGKSLQGIGVDADQAYLGSYILTSAIKKVDQSVLEKLAALDAAFRSGTIVGTRYPEGQMKRVGI